MVHNELLPIYIVLKLWHFAVTGSLWMWFNLKPINLIGVSMCQLVTQLQVFDLPFPGSLRAAFFYSMISQTSCPCQEVCSLLMMPNILCLFHLELTVSPCNLTFSTLANWSSTWKLIFNEKNVPLFVSLGVDFLTYFLLH